jgi:branched-chain amino acid transport system substrate-binding protein
MTFGADPRLLPDSKTVVDEFRNMAPSQRATPCMPTRRSRPWLQRSTAPIQQGRRRRQVAQAHPVKTVMGEKSWDSKGDLKVSDYVVYQWDKDGKYHQLEKQK